MELRGKVSAGCFIFGGKYLRAPKRVPYYRRMGDQGPPCGHTAYSWSRMAGVVPVGHTSFTWTATLDTATPATTVVDSAAVPLAAAASPPPVPQPAGASYDDDEWVVEYDAHYHHPYYRNVRTGETQCPSEHFFTFSDRTQRSYG